MTCEQCELNKRRAQLWRHEAYKLAGYPLDWEPELVVRREWQGLTDEERQQIIEDVAMFGARELCEAIEAALKEKNHDI